MFKKITTTDPQGGGKGGVEASNVINDPKCNKGRKCSNF